MGGMADYLNAKEEEKQESYKSIIGLLEAQLKEQKTTNKYKETQQQEDYRFRNSWRYGKLVAVFFMIVAFSLDVIQINSVEPAVDLALSVLVEWFK